MTLLLAAIVVAIVAYGFIRADPERNPAPATYRDAACAALDELSLAIGALGDAVDDGTSADAAGELATEAETHVSAANDALVGLPEWPPGELLDELLGGMLLDSLNAIEAIREGDIETARADQGSAANALAAAERAMADGQYGFDCD